MDIRYASSPTETKNMTTSELRERFLITPVFVPGQLTVTFSHHDRVVVAGITPTNQPIVLPGYPELRAEFFLERREAGIINVGETGTVTADGVAYRMEKGACLYVGRGVRDVVFESGSDGPAKFFLFSAPAHTAYPTVLTEPGKGTRREVGDQVTSNSRTINQYIHENGVQSCQVVMGVTTLNPGSMWNTMPSHTHDRRMEAYLYFDVPDTARVVHLMGEPTETRHLIMADGEAVISPSWSVHSGVGTSAYSFIWAMAGENQSFDDMDHYQITEMR